MRIKSNDQLRQILNVVTLIVTLVINWLANALPINNITTAEISDNLPSYFTPAGYAFAIWGLIYLSLLGFAIYQALPAQRANPHARRIGYLFAFTGLVNSAWILAWHYATWNYGLSLLLMVILLISLITIYSRLRIGRPETGHADRSRADKLLIHFPFSIYMGWITVATIANAANVLNHWGWNGWGIDEPVWSAIMMVTAVIVAAALLFNRANLPYAGVLVWSLLAIYVNYSDVPVVAATAVVAAMAVAGLGLLGWYRVHWRRRQGLPA
jgi:translocator protein